MIRNSEGRSVALTWPRWLPGRRKQTLADLLGRIREHALQPYRAVLVAAHQSGATLEIEPVARDAAGDPLMTPDLGLPFRTDGTLLRTNAPPAPLQMTAGTILDFAPVPIPWSDTTSLLLKPFLWQRCCILAHGVTGDFRQPLIEWHARWFEPAEPVLPPGLLGVIHEVAAHMKSPGEVQIVADLGSASIDAFEELLHAVASTGATALEVFSPV